MQSPKNKYPAGPGFELRRQKSVKRAQVEMADTLDRSATALVWWKMTGFGLQVPSSDL